MPGPKFFQTGMGQLFYNGHVPRTVAALEQIGRELKRQNDLCDSARGKYENDENYQRARAAMLALEEAAKDAK